MKTIGKIFNVKFQHLQITLWLLLIQLFMMLNMTTTLAQNSVSNDSAKSVPGSSDTSRTLFGGTITNSGYGGIVLKFSSIDDLYAFMTGGRGAITINNRYTIDAADMG